MFRLTDCIALSLLPSSIAFSDSCRIPLMGKILHLQKMYKTILTSGSQIKILIFGTIELKSYLKDELELSLITANISSVEVA